MAHYLSARQRAIMEALWTHGEATVAEVQQRLRVDPPLAYTTVATMLARMEQKGLVAHRVEGRTFYYRAAVTEDEVGRSVFGELLERVSRGEEVVITRHDKAVARLVPEGAPRQDEVRRSVQGLRDLQLQIRRRSKAKLTDREVRAAIELGRR